MLVFVDESGHPIPTDPTIRPILLAVCINEIDIHELTLKINKIKLDVYGKDDVEIKATNLIRSKTLDPRFTNNKLFVDKLIDLINSFNIKVFAIIMERPDFTPYTEEGMLHKQYYHLLRRIEFFCEKYDYPMALTIFDEQDRKEDEKIAIAFNNYLYKTSLGKSFKKILEVPLFANSKVTPGIQIADLMAGIIRHYYERNLNKITPSDPFEKWLCDLYDTVESKTENLYHKYLEYGFFTMSKSNFQKCPIDKKTVHSATGDAEELSS